MSSLNRRKVLIVGGNALAALLIPKLLPARPRSSAFGGTPAADLSSAAGVTLADDFTALGTSDIIGRTIRDSAGREHSWTQLYPSPAWREGRPLFSTGDPGIVNGKLVRRDPDTAMYPGLLLPGVPAHVEVDFTFDADANRVGGRSVFIHLFADTDGTRTATEIPFHLSVGERGYAVTAMSTTAGDSELTGFGEFPDSGNVNYSSGEALPFGVRHTLMLDTDGDTVTITFPAAAQTDPVTLTDVRLRQARHPGGGDGRFLVLEDESDSAIEPYNGFTGVRIDLGPGGDISLPTIAAIVPSLRGQGAKNQSVRVTGIGFAPGARVSISGSGVTIASNQTFISSSEIQFRLSVTGNAAVGARALAVTNPDGSTCEAPFTVTPKPQPLSASPSVARSTSQTVTIAGTGFVSGKGLAVQVIGAGITTSAPTWVSATSLTVTVSVAATAASDAYKVTVTNPDGGKGSRAKCLTVT